MGSRVDVDAWYLRARSGKGEQKLNGHRARDQLLGWRPSQGALLSARSSRWHSPSARAPPALARQTQGHGQGQGQGQGQDRGVQGESGSWVLDAAILLQDTVAVPCCAAATRQQGGAHRQCFPSALPPEVLKQCLLPALDAKTLASLAMTCRDLNWAVETAEGLWEQMYRRDIPAGDRKGWRMAEPGFTALRGSEGGRQGGGRG